LDWTKTFGLTEVIDHEQPAINRMQPPKGGVGTLGGGQLLDRCQSPLGIPNLEGIFGFGRFFRTPGSSLTAPRRAWQRHVGQCLEVELAQPHIATVPFGMNRTCFRV
jgi:hypothetical protein